MSAYTPGPWKISHYAGMYDVITDDSYDFYAVAEIDERSPNAEANALFIIAGPDMLEALEAILREYERLMARAGVESSAYFRGFSAGAHAAIAKAKGEA